MGTQIQNNGSNTAPPVTNDPSDRQADSLLRCKGDPSAMLMAVMSSISSKENELRLAQSQMRGEAINSEADSAKAGAQAGMDSATSEAVNDGLGAGLSLGGAAHGVGSYGKGSRIHSDYTKTIDAHSKAIENAKSANGVGPSAPQHSPHDVAKLEHERSELINRRDHEGKQHLGNAEHERALTQVGSGLSKAFTSVSQGQTNAASKLDDVAGKMAGQMAQNIQGSEDSAKDTARTALQFTVAGTAVAATRG